MSFLLECGAPMGNRNAAKDYAGQTDYGKMMADHQAKPHEQLVSEYEKACHEKTGAPPFGKWHKTASKQQLAQKLVDLGGHSFDKFGKKISAASSTEDQSLNASKFYVQESLSRRLRYRHEINGDRKRQKYGRGAQARGQSSPDCGGVCVHCR